MDRTLHMELTKKHSFSQQVILSCIMIYFRQVMLTTILQGWNCHPCFTDKNKNKKLKLRRIQCYAQGHTTSPEIFVMGVQISLTLSPFCYSPQWTERRSWLILKWEKQLCHDHKHYGEPWSILSWCIYNSQNRLIMLWNSFVHTAYLKATSWEALYPIVTPGQRFYHLTKSTSQYNALRFTTAREGNVKSCNMALKCYWPQVTKIHSHFVGQSRSQGHT